MREFGLIFIFKFVYRRGVGIKCNFGVFLVYWGCMSFLVGEKKFFIVIIFLNKIVLLIVDYVKDIFGCNFKYYLYKFNGIDVNLIELVFKIMFFFLLVLIG